MEGVFLVPFAPFMFVLGIIYLNNRRKLEEKRIAARMTSQVDSHALRERDGRIDELENRVRVLERIVTDGGYDLAHKIEALRDERPLSQRLQARELEEKL